MISGDTIGWLSFKLLVAATPPAVVRSIFDGVSDNGQISVMQAWKALRTNDAFALGDGLRRAKRRRVGPARARLRRAQGGGQEKYVVRGVSTRGALGRRAVSGGRGGGPRSAAGTQSSASSAMSKLRAAVRASTTFRATAAAAAAAESSGGPPDLPPPAPSSPWFDSNF